MPSALLIRVRFHDGRYHGAGSWPPSPSRLFQALVAGTARGAALETADRAALRWLEGLAPPVIAAPEAVGQRGFVSYVPNNDLDARGGDPQRAIRVGKNIRAFVFDAETPLLYLWADVTPSAEAERLIALTRDLYQLGRGVDPAWAEAALVDPAEADAEFADHPGRLHRPGVPGADGWATPMPGSLESLEARFAANRARFGRVVEGRVVRQSFTQPPKARFGQVVYDSAPRILVYELRDDSSERFVAVPAAAAGPLVKGLIAGATERLARALPDQAEVIGRIMAGRDAGSADLPRRLRVFPVPSIGHEHVDRAIRRIAVEIPPGCPLGREDIDWAFTGLPRIDPESGEVLAGRLVRAPETRMLDRLTGAARRWRSETPLALSTASRRRIEPGCGTKDGRERAGEEARAAGAVLQALRHAGVVARAISVRVQREPFAPRGIRADAFAAGTRFSKHALWHAQVEFARPVAGPLILGDGRFAGLGLMVPASEPMRLCAFTIQTGLAHADAGALTHALRRAVMARVRDWRNARVLPTFYSGHTADGGPARDGGHGHIACIADLPRSRLLVVPPHAIEHRNPRDAKERGLLEELAMLLDGFDILRAGPAGLLRLAPERVDPDTDPLLAPARLWESITPYTATRHPKRLTPAEALAADIRLEAARRGLPVPEVEVIEASQGPRGGMSGRARLRFAVAQPGPIMLGQQLHRGGGLFARTGN